MSTWKVIEWPNKPSVTHTIELCCPKCGADAELEIGPMPGGLVIAAIGLGLVFDPPGYVPPEDSMPEAIQCRKCRTIWGEALVR